MMKAVMRMQVCTMKILYIHILCHFLLFNPWLALSIMQHIHYNIRGPRAKEDFHGIHQELIKVYPVLRAVAYEIYLGVKKNRGCEGNTQCKDQNY